MAFKTSCCLEMVIDGQKIMVVIIMVTSMVTVVVVVVVVMVVMVVVVRRVWVMMEMRRTARESV